MGIKRYLTPSNWYSDKVEILLKRKPGQPRTVNLKDNHYVAEVTEDNIADTQRFENQSFTKTYKEFLSHGDMGFFGYVDGKCACRLWGRIKPAEQMYHGTDLGFDNDGVYVHYVETAADARRQGIGRECLSYLVNHCSDRVMYVMIEMENKASITLHKGLGFKEAAILHVRKRCMKVMTSVYWLV